MRRVRGYTVVEMLVVLFIIVIMGALVAPGLGQLMKRSKVSSSAASVAGALRTARAMAITTNDVYHVRVHTSGGEYWLSTVWVRDEDKRYVVPVPALAEGEYETLGSERLEEGTRVTPVQALYFWPDGTASQGVVFTVEVEDPDQHDTPVRIGVSASGVVEELP